MKSKALPLFFLVAAIATMTACGPRDQASTSPSPGEGGLADSAATAAADLAASAPDPHDACRLITQAEAEAVLGAPLAGVPYLAGQPNGDSAGMPQEGADVCWYSTADNHSLAVSAEWENAGAISAGVGGRLAKGEKASGGLLKLQNGTEMTGDWDEAKLTGCCTLTAILGDSSVDIDFGASKATEAQAGELANKALGRLTAPLAVNGKAGQKDALKRILKRYSSDDPCALWTAADITRLLGAPKGEPERSDNNCTWAFTNKQGRGAMFNATVTLRNGYRQFRTDNATYAGFAQGINAMGTDENVKLKETQVLEGPWEAAENGPIQFSSVRKDAAISLRQAGMSLDDIRALVGAGYDHIEAGAKP
jgi:hypothetical protein